MAPVSTTVLPFSPAPRVAAVSAMVSVPWVITMRFSGTDAHRSKMWRRPASSIWRLSIIDRKSTRLNSSHLGISYAVFCLKKKTELVNPPDINITFADDRRADVSEYVRQKDVRGLVVEIITFGTMVAKSVFF